MKFVPLLALCALGLFTAARAEDGYDLWLRYQPLEKSVVSRYAAMGTSVVTAGRSATVQATRDELVRGLSGLLARKVTADDTIRRDGAILFGTPANSPTIASLKLPLDRVGPEGY